MLKKLLMIVATLVATMGLAFADVDVNKADKAALDSVKGIGPKTSQMILDERQKGGEFKDWADLQSRVKGIKAKSAKKLSDAGLTVNGQAMMAASGAKPAASKPMGKAAAKPASAPASTPAASAAPAPAPK